MGLKRIKTVDGGVYNLDNGEKKVLKGGQPGSSCQSQSKRGKVSLWRGNVCVGHQKPNRGHTNVCTCLCV